MSELERSDHGAITESPTLLPATARLTSRPAAAEADPAAEAHTASEPGRPLARRLGAHRRPGAAPLHRNRRPHRRSERRRLAEAAARKPTPGTARRWPGTAGGGGDHGGGDRVRDERERRLDRRNLPIAASPTTTSPSRHATDAGLPGEDRRAAPDPATRRGARRESVTAGRVLRAPSPARTRPPRSAAAGVVGAAGARAAVPKRTEATPGRPPATQPRPARPRYVDAGAQLSDVDVDGTALLDSLDDETLARRRGTHRKGRPAGRYLMVVHQRDDGIAHIAVLEGRTLVEHYVSMPTDDTLSIDGNIYLGRVQNVLPGMEAAFIDIGTPKNGVLYRGDVIYDPADVEGSQRPRIESVLRNGQSIIVQVTKNPIAHKGARLTQEVSLAGRFVVMVPGQPQTYGISKRLPDDERKRLRQVLDRLRPADAGLIVRTAAEGATEEELERDMLRLNEQWRQISEFAKKAKPGSLLYKEPPLATRLIREEFTKEVPRRRHRRPRAVRRSARVRRGDRARARRPRRVLRRGRREPADLREVPRARAAAQGARAQGLAAVGRIARDRAHRSAHRDRRQHRQERRARRTSKRRCTGTISRRPRRSRASSACVTSAASSSPTSSTWSLDRTAKRSKRRSVRRLRVTRRTQVFPISELGLLEMTRKRVSEGLVEVFSTTCPQCNGRGFIVDESLLE